MDEGCSAQTDSRRQWSVRDDGGFLYQYSASGAELQAAAGATVFLIPPAFLSRTFLHLDVRSHNVLNRHLRASHTHTCPT